MPQTRSALLPERADEPSIRSWAHSMALLRRWLGCSPLAVTDARASECRFPKDSVDFAMALEAELATFEAALPGLLAEKAGKFAVVTGNRLIGTYDTYEDALKVGYGECGLAPFLVRRIAPGAQVAHITRLTTPCPA